MNYNKTLSNILLSMISVAILAAIINYVINQFAPEEEHSVTKIYDVIITPNITKDNSNKPSKIEPPSGSSNPKLSPIIVFSPRNIKDTIDENKKMPTIIDNTGTGTGDTTGTGIVGNMGGNGTGTNSNVYGLDSVTETTKPFLIVTEMPEFPGGQEEMIKFIQSRMNYPVHAIEAHISGVCYLRFVVNADGHITNVEVIKSVPDCHECDEEAKRVVESMPLWKPGKQNGKPVPVYMQIPVRFKIK
ncbi:MAG: energy transducer TonB [Bacteroidia bacterium]